MAVAAIWGSFVKKVAGQRSGRSCTLPRAAATCLPKGVVRAKVVLVMILIILMTLPMLLLERSQGELL